MKIQHTMKVTVDLTFTCSQLTYAELRRAIGETFGGFCEQNIDFVSLTNPNTGEVYGERLVDFNIQQ